MLARIIPLDSRDRKVLVTKHGKRRFLVALTKNRASFARLTTARFTALEVEIARWWLVGRGFSVQTIFVDEF